MSRLVICFTPYVFPHLRWLDLVTFAVDIMPCLSRDLELWQCGGPSCVPLTLSHLHRIDTAARRTQRKSSQLLEKLDRCGTDVLLLHLFSVAGTTDKLTLESGAPASTSP